MKGLFFMRNHVCPFIINGNHAVFVSFTVILCEMQVSVRSGTWCHIHQSYWGLEQIDQLYTSCAHSERWGLGALKEVADDRNLNTAVLTGMTCCPFFINSGVFKVE